MSLLNNNRREWDSGNEEEEREWYKRFSMYYALSCLMVVVGLLAIGMSQTTGPKGESDSGPSYQPYNGGFVGSNNKGNGGGEVYVDPYEGVDFTTYGPLEPEPAVPQPQADANKAQMSHAVEVDYAQNDWEWDLLAEEEASQDMALGWLSGTESYEGMGDSRKKQRYALACFYYATYMRENEFVESPSDWVSAEHWLSEEHECSWEGVTCDNEEHVIGLKLDKNALSGSIPFDLALLTNLTSINLSQNFIFAYGSMLDFLEYMPQLEELLLDDNFIMTASGGLPDQLKYLTNLGKLQMSYNLLQGSMDGRMFEDMTALTHLEVESNYLTGTIPSQLGQIPDLIYLYLRRNSLEIDLDKILEPDNAYPSIFSFWIDSNIVEGTLPTKLGQLSELASLSITNTSLAGPIPTEFGSLSNLQRIWLYHNELTGTIPTNSLSNLEKVEVFEIYGNDLAGGSVPFSICSSVSASGYEYKAVSADCEEIECSCCTTCY